MGKKFLSNIVRFIVIDALKCWLIVDLNVDGLIGRSICYSSRKATSVLEEG